MARDEVKQLDLLTRHHHLHDVPLSDFRTARLGDQLGLSALPLLLHRHLAKATQTDASEKNEVCMDAYHYFFLPCSLLLGFAALPLVTTHNAMRGTACRRNGGQKAPDGK